MQYVDTFSNRHVWGIGHFVSWDFQKPENSELVMHQVSTVGVALIKLPQKTGISLGYTQDFDMQVKDNFAEERPNSVNKPSNFEGYAHKYKDNDGNRHYWGVGHLISPDLIPERSDLVMHQVSTVGVALIRLPQKVGFSVGYTRDMDIQIKDNVAGQFSLSPNNPSDIIFKDFTTIQTNIRNNNFAAILKETR